MTGMTVVFDESNSNWTPDAISNELFLKSVQMHMNNVLCTRGHVFLNDVFDVMNIPRTKTGQVSGWVHDDETSIDFGTKHVEGTPNLELTFNVQGVILDMLP